MNVMNFLDYNSIANVRKTMMIQDIDGSVYKNHDVSNIEGKGSIDRKDNDDSMAGIHGNLAGDNADGNERETLSIDKVIDKAVNSDMKTDKELIGSRSSLESLDVSRAISEAGRDELFKEYRTFVQNADTDAGIGTFMQSYDAVDEAGTFIKSSASEDGIVIKRWNGDRDVQL